jgi:hypothetical protein
MGVTQLAGKEGVNIRLSIVSIGAIINQMAAPP